MTDSHVHLNHPDFREDFDDVISRAQEAGITRMVNIGFDLESSLETVGLTERFGFMYGAVGVHPHDARTYSDDVEQALEKLLEKPSVLAVGEIGLDFYRDLTPRDQQRRVFKRQLAMARRKNKPVIIHCRDAFEDVIAVLSENDGVYQGIFHAFTGTVGMAEQVNALGFHIGIGGPVTFRNSTLPNVLTSLPLDAFVLETDCPYLTPVPFRGKRNEPAYVTYVLAKLSELTGIPAEELVEKTDRNFDVAMQLQN